MDTLATPTLRELLAPAGTRLLALGSLLGRIATAMVPVVVVLRLAESTSFATAGLAMAAYAAGTVALGPARSWAAVRFGHGPAMLVLGLLSGGALAVAALGHADVQVVAMAVCGAAIPPFGALLRAGWSQRLPGAWVDRAFGLDSVMEESSFVVGPLVASGAVALVGSGPTMVATGAVGAVAAAVMAIAARHAPVDERAARRPQGLLTVVRRTAWLMLGVAGVGFGIGALEVGIPATATEAGRASLAGLLFAAWALGSAAATVVYSRRSWSTGPAIRMTVLGLLFAVAIAALAVVSGPLWVVVLALSGAVMGPAVMTAYLAADRVARDAASRTHLAVWSTIACNAGVAAGAAVAGAAIGRFGARPTHLIVGGVVAVATLGGLALWPARDTPSEDTPLDAARSGEAPMSNPVRVEDRRRYFARTVARRDRSRRRRGPLPRP